jgi:hypothetical protein
VTIKQLIDTWRHNIALHATLEIKRISPINNNEREIVTMSVGNPERLKLQGKADEDVDLYCEIEILAKPDVLKKFKFAPGKHVGLVLRVID